MRYTNDYEEHRTLSDGTRLLLRMVRPSDKQAFAEGLAGLSERTRYQRFMAPKKGFTDAELVFLTEVDGENHLAIVAGRERPGAEPEGIGVGRLVRMEDDPESAELGIVVADAWQRRGIGRLLLERTTAAAAERGIRRIRAQLMADNGQALGLLKGFRGDSEEQTDHGVLTLEFPVPEQNPDESVDALMGLIRAIGQGVAITPEQISEMAAHPVDSMLSMVTLLRQTVTSPSPSDNDRCREWHS
ncbi:MAG: N-acetyltransferase [Gammaproteobacteria bacterium]|nr:MAG: N-acetyltransferase [Gammaproteobacteria bacterium]